MNLSALIAEVQARGFDTVSSARITTWINVAYNELLETADWPFLTATASGIAPLTISDLRTIESVAIADRKLEPADRRDLSDRYMDLSVEGTPESYFLTSATTLDTYPRGTDTLTVRYWKAPAELSGSDTPVIPARYHYAIVDWAVARAYEDSDEPQMAAAARAAGDRLLQAMTTSLLNGQHDRPTRMVMSGGHWDG